MKANKTESTREPEEHPQVHVSRKWRVVVHIWVAIHLTALVAAPLAFATREGPPKLPQYIASLVRPYIDLCYLDHGYAFFAPEIGPAHLVEYQVWETADAEPQVERFPDLNRQWPRLLYHRHFMLSEHLNQTHVPLNVPAEFFVSEQEYRRSQAQRAMFQKLRDSFAEHLLHKYQAERVELVRIEHRQPNVPEFENGTLLDEEQLYRELPDTFAPDMLPPDGALPPTPLAPEAGGPQRFPYPYAPESVPTREVVP